MNYYRDLYNFVCSEGDTNTRQVINDWMDKGGVYYWQSGGVPTWTWWNYFKFFLIKQIFRKAKRSE